MMKRFFRPTKLKVVLAIIIFMLLPIPVRSFIVECPEGSWCGDIVGYKNMILPLGGFLFFAALFVGGNDVFMYPIDYLWKLAYLLIVAYLLSCTIVYIFGRVSRKKS